MTKPLTDSLVAASLVAVAVIAVPNCHVSSSAPRTDLATAPAPDYCRVYGWYGDGGCDAFCAQPDPDCAAEPPRNELVIAEIEAWNAGIRASDRARKYCAMASSPFVFFRGTDHLYWRDLGRDKRLGLFGSAATAIWLQGDLHAQTSARSTTTTAWSSTTSTTTTRS